MIFSSFVRASSDLEAAKSFFTTNSRLRTLLAQNRSLLEPDYISDELSEISSIAPATLPWRVQDHCAAVGRIYAIFEQFCESILSEWVDFRVKDCNISMLPERMVSAYSEGVIFIVSSLKQVRYTHLSEASIIAEYNKALSNRSDFRIAAECLTYHRNNLRLPDVVEIFDKCGIPNCEQWIANHPKMVDHFQIQRRVNEQTASKLSNFVQYRNDAAHGAVSVDEVLGEQEIEDYCDFFYCLMVALYELVTDHAISWLEFNDNAKLIGAVSETFRGNIVVAHVEGARISKGDTIYMRSSKSCVFRTVEQIRLNDKEEDDLIVARPVEVGLRFDAQPLKKARLYLLR